MMETETTKILGLGVDISKKRAEICLKNPAVADSFAVSNDDQGISTLLRKLKPYVEAGLVVKGAIESTGNLWMRVYEALEQSGIDIALANPLKTKAIAEARIKSDGIDASILADLARADLVAKCYVPDKRTREVRSLVRYRVDLAQRSTELKNKVHNILDKYSLRYDGLLFTDRGLEWLNEQVRNRLSVIDGQLVNSYLKEIATMEELIASVERQMAKLAIKDKKVELLLGFTGIDYYYGALLLLYEIGDITRFSNPRKLVSWAGLAPSLHQSGIVSYTGRITKQGNRRVRWYLVEAAQRAARYDPKLKPFYERIAQRKGHQKAIVAVARKILVSVYWVLTRNEPYDGYRDDVKTRKLKRLERLSAC